MNTTSGSGFEPVHAVGSFLYGLTVPWWITGGWAIDLAVGHRTRDHANVDVMMLERDEHALRDLTGVDIELVADGQPPGPWPAGRRLTAGPHPGPKGPGAGPPRLIVRCDDLPLPLEVSLASAVESFWVFRRGARIFTRPLADITRYWQGIPFLAPEVVLLIKAWPGPDRSGTDKDERDFEVVLPMLSVGQRSWLKDAIEQQSWLKEAIEPPPGRKEASARPRSRAEEPAAGQRLPRHRRWAADLGKP